MSLILTVRDRLVTQFPAFGVDMTNRPYMTGALQAFEDDTKNTLRPDVIQKIENSIDGTPVKIPVLDSQTVSIISTRTCTIPCTESDSKLLDVTFVTVGFNICQHPAQYANNYIGQVADFEWKLTNRLNQLRNYLDTLAVAKLETFKNVIFTGGVSGIYTPSAGNALQVPQIEKDNMYNQIQSILALQRFDPIDYATIYNPQHAAMIRRDMQQGGANATNLGWQFNGYRPYQTNNIVNSGAGVESTAYIAAKGSLAFLNRNSVDSRLGHSSTDGTEWSEMYFPIVDKTMGVLYKSTCGTFNGVAQSLQESWQITTDVVFVTTHITNPLTEVTPVTKYEVLN